MSTPPPLDRIAVALYRRGAVAQAIEVAHLAMARNDPRRIECRVAFDRMRRGESPDEGRVGPDLDAALVATLVDAGRLFEARAVVQGAKPEGGLAAKMSRTLEEALAPFPPDADPSFAAVLQLVRAGQAASAMRALEEVVKSAPPPDWLAIRSAALSSLVTGAWRGEAEPVPAVTRDTVLAHLRARDIVAALSAAKAAGATELAEVLKRLVAGTDRLFAEGPPDSDDPETSPMEGHRLAEFHVRMGVLAEADRDYRALLRADPHDERGRTMLADVIALRRALGEQTVPMPPRPSAAMDSLKKNAPRAPGKGWASGPRYAAFEDTEEGSDSTAKVSAADEAELLLKLGKTEQALDMFRILAIRHPNQQAFRKRIAEIEALIAQRLSPAASEATVRADVSKLRARAVPTSPAVKLPENRHAGFEEDESEDIDPTYVDKSPLDDD
jgi:tetratricopeptide (TPR) repeat protein